MKRLTVWYQDLPGRVKTWLRWADIAIVTALCIWILVSWGLSFWHSLVAVLIISTWGCRHGLRWSDRDWQERYDRLQEHHDKQVHIIEE